MARYASKIEIAGVVFTGCKGLLLDGSELADPIKGSVEWAMDSTPHPQTINTQFRGVQFGIAIAPESDSGIQIAKVNQALNAIKTARGTVGYFVFDYIDEQYNVKVKAIPDYSQQWYKTDKFSEGFVSNVVFRFIVREAIAVSLSS